MKWIDAHFLDQWSTSNASEGQLPELVRDLVLSSVEERAQISDIRFPIGNMARIPGYDGMLSVSISHQFIPDGDSVWEIKTSKDYEGEANKDFAKRSQDPKGIDKSTTTFVFVSSKAWKDTKRNSKEEWVNKKKEEDPSWKDIVFIDAVDLEQWLEFCPATSANFARRVGKSPLTGAKGIDEYWNMFINRYLPALKISTLLTSRIEQAKKTIDELLYGISTQRIQADSVDEVIAFVIAAIYSSGDDKCQFLKSRTLILENAEAVNHFSSYRGMVFIVLPTLSPHCGYLGQNNSLIIPKGKKEINRDHIILTRPTTYELAQSLEDLGLSEDDAMRASKESGGSITILARRRPSVDSNQPDWVQTHGSSMVPAFLAGSWDESNENDKSILSDLSGIRKYSDYQEKILNVLTTDDSPIEREASIWKVIAPVDTFVNVSSLISDNHCKRLKEAATSVFSEINPNLIETEFENNDASELFRKTTKYSRWLRDGLATTLLQIAALHEEIDIQILNSSSQQFVNDIITCLPGLKDDPRVIMSLDSELPYLMEAAPDPLLEALEYMLEGDPKKALVFFDESDGMFSHSHHTELLWGLECLAWNPKYIKKACMILARLAQIDPGGKTMNRPINSLTEIFLLWHPGTYANLQQRLIVIDAIIKFDPALAWELIANLLPKFHSVSHNTNKPIYRESGGGKYEKLTYENLYKSHQEVINRAILLADINHNRWIDLLDVIPNTFPEIRAKVIKALEDNIHSFSGQSRIDFWNHLRSFISEHKSHPDAKWSIKGDDLLFIEKLCKQITPQSSLEQFKFLFNENNPRLPDPDSKYNYKTVEEERLKAINKIYHSNDMEGIIELAEGLRTPQFLASAFVNAINDISVFKDVTERSHGQSENLTRFTHALSSCVKHKYNTEWDDIVLELIEKNDWNDNLVTELILSWPNVKQTWDFVSKLGQGVSSKYWKNKSAWISRDMSTADIEFSAQKFIENSRAISAIETIHENAAEIDLSLVSSILKNAIDEINELEYPNNMLSYYIEKIFDALAMRSDVYENDLAMLEYAYFPILERKKNNLTIHKILAKDPTFYISLIKDAFKASKSEKVPKASESQRKAEAAFRLLDSFKILPGYSDDEINSETLTSWVNSVLTLARENDREIITQQYIGKLLAHAPVDPIDNGWPHKKIRDLIEEIELDEVEKGIEIERFNMRGVYIKDSYEGGQQERSLAKQYQEWAFVSSKWVRTNDMLNEIAKKWEYHAKKADSEAKLDRLKS